MIYKSLWGQMPQQLENFLHEESRSKEFKRGQFVYRQDDEPKGLFWVEEGLVGLTIIGPSSGREHLLRFFRQGQFFGHRSLFSEENYHASAIVLERTLLRFVEKAKVLEYLQQNPKLYLDFIRVMAKELGQCELRGILILENQILARTAQALVYLKDLHPEHQWTRQEIANFCASTVSTIIKALAHLETKGLIVQEGRQITIKDRQGLIQLEDTEKM